MTNLYEAGDVNQASSRDDARRRERGVDRLRGRRREPGVGGTRTGASALSVLRYLARSLSNDPESVVIDVDERRGSLRLRLHVAPEDMGRVIGRRGRTAQAIRTLVNVASTRDGVQASVDIVDD